MTDAARKCWKAHQMKVGRPGKFDEKSGANDLPNLWHDIVAALSGRVQACRSPSSHSAAGDGSNERHAIHRPQGDSFVAKAVLLSGTEAGAIYVFDDLQREFHLRAWLRCCAARPSGFTPEMQQRIAIETVLSRYEG